MTSDRNQRLARLAQLRAKIAAEQGTM
jgi:hypothetical protein